MRSVRVPSRATSLASAVADSSTSPAASAGSAIRSASRSALPVLLEITSLPHIRLLLGESPSLQILFAGAQRVQQSLRLAAIHGFLVRRLARPRLRLALALLLGGRILALLRLALLLLASSGILRRRLLPLARRIAFLRLGLLLSALPRAMGYSAGSRARARSSPRGAPPGWPGAGRAAPRAASPPSRRYSRSMARPRDPRTREKTPGGAVGFATTTTRSGAARSSASRSAVMRRPSGAAVLPRGRRPRRAGRRPARRNRGTCRRTGPRGAIRTQPCGSSPARGGISGRRDPRRRPPAARRCRGRSARQAL